MEFDRNIDSINEAITYHEPNENKGGMKRWSNSKGLFAFRNVEDLHSSSEFNKFKFNIKH